ncbi:hypothetical protein H0H81_004844 [Sphagnurus paluster]|uniref:Uncharacterized protein n=1 Tax=Sphagnurus paluster TaxID=117069 RepID=A0A9P7GPZ1_9AGAR|nr:hypothetical protein H0H81_004844 [Sphagnurus paluster]
MLAAATVMQLAGAKIEHFRWEFPDPSQEDLVGSPEWFLPVELRLLPRLRSLTIVTDSQIVQASSVRDLLSARSLPENSPIDRITIILICANLDLIVSQLYETRMDESLSVVGLGRSPPRSVQITIWILCDPKIAKSLGTDVASSWTVWGEQLRQWFPLTSSREPPVKGGIDGFSRFFQLLEDDVVAV